MRPERDAHATTSNELLSLVARASDLLGSTLDPSEVVWSLARLVVPSLADWSIITLVNDDGTLNDVEAWHHEPERRQITRIFAEHRYAGRTERAGSLSALASGEPFVIASGARAFARDTLRSAVAQEALVELELESAVVVPMLGGGRVIGLITLCRGPEREPMTAPELDVTVDIARRASITFSRARSYERQRTSSEQLQRSLLTQPMPQRHLEVVTRYVPAAQEAQIGGDWYDVFTQPDGATVLVVGDVAGHDIAAAAMMGQLRSMLRGIGVTTGSGPARLLTELDRAIEALGLDASATAAVVRLRADGDGARLAYSNAGHPAPLLAHPDGRVEALGEHDTLLGVVPDEQRQQVDSVLQPGGTLLLFSDGLVERRTEDIDVGHAALERAFGEAYDAPLDQLVDRLVTDLLPAVHDDDVAVLAVRLRG